MQCVWKGTASIKASFHESNNIHQIKMGLDGFPFGFPKDTTISGYRISFIDLVPYPVTLSSPLPTEKSAVFTITY